MDNRRAHYRHAFPTAERPRVELELPEGRGTCAGEIINLSLGGMQVRLPERLPALDLLARVVARPALPGARLATPSTLVYARPEGVGVRCGLAFFRSVHPWGDDTRDKALWRFLLGAQVRQRREQIGERSDAAGPSGEVTTQGFPA